VDWGQLGRGGELVKALLSLLVALPVAAGLYAMSACDGGTPVTATETQTATATPGYTVTQTPDATATATWTTTHAPTATETRTPGPTWTPWPTLTVTPMQTLMPPETPVPCDQMWPFTSGERLRIQGAAVYWLRSGPEIDLIPAQDALCGLGMYEHDLGAPMTTVFAVEGDVRGDVIRCRAFALGVVCVLERPGLDDCQHYALLAWSGEVRE
jgi:hypothetical protein